MQLSTQFSSRVIRKQPLCIANTRVKLRTSEPLPRNLQKPLRHWGNVVVTRAPLSPTQPASIPAHSPTLRSITPFLYAPPKLGHKTPNLHQLLKSAVSFHSSIKPTMLELNSQQVLDSLTNKCLKSNIKLTKECREDLAENEYTIAYTDAATRPPFASYSSELFCPSDGYSSNAHYTDMLHYHHDNNIMEMEGIIKTAAWVSMCYPHVEYLLIVTDSHLSYQLFNGIGNIGKRNLSEIYAKYRDGMHQCKEIFHSFRIGWVPREEFTMRRIDRRGKTFIDDQLRPQEKGEDFTKEEF